jgi:azurin
MRRLPILLLTAMALTVAACGGDQAAPGTTGAATNGDAREVVITPVGNEMRFQQTEFSVRAGERIRLVMRNTATSPAMQHNVVIVDSRDSINRVGQAALTAGAARQYVPDDPAVLAFTPMAAPGQTTEVVFTAPEQPGDYPYICTFPGHYTMMQGTMRVTR